MSRALFQVLVFPYRLMRESKFEYALFKRMDEGFWQGIAGGGEDDETPLEAARRETFEESGINPGSEFIQLDTIESIPVTEFRESPSWGDQIYVIPQYCFGVRVDDRAIILSEEHTEYKWFLFEEAYRQLKFDGNKTALWELDRRISGRGPRG